MQAINNVDFGLVIKPDQRIVGDRDEAWGFTLPDRWDCEVCDGNGRLICRFSVKEGELLFHSFVKGNVYPLVMESSW